MAWEQRGQRQYYTRSRRVGGRVTRTYYGQGTEAHLAAALDAQKRMQRKADAEEQQAVVASLIAIDSLAQDFHAGVAILTEAVLLAAGYYRHDRGQWRRRGVHGRTT